MSAKAEPSIRIDPATRTITIPLRNGDATITIPREFVTGDVKRLAWALLPYATDFDPDVSRAYLLPDMPMIQPGQEGPAMSTGDLAQFSSHLLSSEH